MSEAKQFFVVFFKTNTISSSSSPHKPLGAIATHPEPRRHCTSFLPLINLAHEQQYVTISFAMQAAFRDPDPCLSSATSSSGTSDPRGNMRLGTTSTFSKSARVLPSLPWRSRKTAVWAGRTGFRNRGDPS
jgi:hypothetical protein